MFTIEAADNKQYYTFIGDHDRDPQMQWAASLQDAIVQIRTALHQADSDAVRALVGFHASIEDEHSTILYEGETRDLAHLSLVNPQSWQLDITGGHYTDTIQIPGRG